MWRIHWEKNAIESKAFLSKSMYITDSNQYTIELATYLLVLVVYFYEFIVYMFLERNAFDLIAFFYQCKHCGKTIVHVKLWNWSKLSFKFFACKIIFSLSKYPFNNNIAILESKVIYFCLRSNFRGSTTSR